MNKPHIQSAFLKKNLFLFFLFWNFYTILFKVITFAKIKCRNISQTEKRAVQTAIPKI